jgi:hypothetical protein
MSDPIRSESLCALGEDREQAAAAQSVSSVLLVEERSASTCDTDAQDVANKHPFRILDLPGGPANLSTAGANAPSLVEIAADELSGHVFVFDVALSAAGEQLMMFSGPERGMRVNGLPAPILSPLVLGDQLRTPDGHLLHVSRRIQTDPVRPPDRLIGQSCGVCLVPFVRETRVLLCSSCGAARHMEGEEVDPDERLECGALGACPQCLSETPEFGELAFVPED